MKRAWFVSPHFSPIKRKRKYLNASEEIESATSHRFSAVTAPSGMEDIPQEIWAYIFSMASVPNREFKSVQLVSKWFYNTYWDGLSSFVFNREGSIMVHRALMTCRREALFALELYHCPIARINKYLSRMKNLKKLVLRTDQSRIRGAGLSNLTKLPLLSVLDLNCLSFSENQTNPKLDIISQLGQLSSLSLSGCAIIDNEGLELICRLSNLSVLRLDLTRGYFTDQGLSALQNLKKLKSLSLSFFSSSNRVTDVGMNSIAALAQLETLHLSNCHLSDFGVDLLGQALGNLRELSLSDCSNVTGMGLQHFKSLRLLDLGGTAFHDGAVQAISANDCLEFLDVSSCGGLSDDGLSSIFDYFPFLRGLNVGNCRRIKCDKRAVMRRLKFLDDLVLPAYPKLVTSKIAKLFRSKLRGEERIVLPSGEVVNVDYDQPTDAWYYSEIDEEAREAREEARLKPTLLPSAPPPKQSQQKASQTKEKERVSAPLTKIELKERVVEKGAAKIVKEKRTSVGELIAREKEMLADALQRRREFEDPDQEVPYKAKKSRRLRIGGDENH